MTTKRSKANSAAATAVGAVAVSGKGSVSKSGSKGSAEKSSKPRVAKADAQDRAPKSSLLGGRKRDSKGPYKLLAIDLDGTFLDHEGEAHEEDIVAIKKLKARGIMVTILTGRLYSGTKESAEILGIEGPVGCADGSHIVRVAGQKTLFHRGIRGRAANKLRASLEREDLVAFLFAEDAIVHDERGADYLPYVRTWSTDLRYAHRITEHALWDSKDGMTAVVALGHETSIGRTVADIQRDTSESMQVAMFPFRRDVEHWGMVARASGGTKATALEWIAKHYGVSVEETVCVGDWMNDLPMLGAAGRSFAMGQAPDEVKKAATDVLERTITTGGGIAEAIARAFGR